jgi:DNA processing protein
VLIKSNKANLLTHVKDLEYHMNWSAGVKPLKKRMQFDLSEYDADEQEVLKRLLENNYQLTIDEISWRTALPIGKLASILLSLELKNIVAALPGKIYKLLVV